MLDRKWILEEIWGSIQFYVFLCDWNFLVAVYPHLLSISCHFSCCCRGTNKKLTTMQGIGLEEIFLVSIVKNTGESDMVSSRICPRLFLHIGLKFTSDREYFLVEMCILWSLVIFRPCGRVAKLGNKWNNKSFETIFWHVPHPLPLVWLVIESNNFSYVSLGHSRIIEKFRI